MRKGVSDEDDKDQRREERLKVDIAVFASGRGSNFAAIIKAVRSQEVEANLALLVCDNPLAGAIKHAEDAKIKVALVQKKDFPGRKDFEAAIIRHLEENRIDLIVLAGFMQLLGADFINRYKNRILNIHPSLLPSFKGSFGIRDAFGYGVKITGVTVHFVDEKMDHGPIILQEGVKIEEIDTPESLEEKIHALEHRLYPLAIKLYSEGKLKIEGRCVRVTNL